MQAKGIFKKVAIDMSLVQSGWAGWFFGIVLIVYVAVNFLGGNVEVQNQAIENHSVLTFIHSPSKVFMFVIGIISISGFLTFYVKQGITRRDYFYGGAVSAVVVAVALMAVAWIFTVIESFINSDLVNHSFLGPEASWLLTAVIFSLLILSYYAGGWLIGAGFYRFGAGGLLYILLAIFMISFVESLWEFKKTHFLLIYFNLGEGEIPMGLSILGTILAIALSLVIVRVTTKRVRIKMK